MAQTSVVFLLAIVVTSKTQVENPDPKDPAILDLRMQILD
jgi:hypothetical protein